MKDLLTKVLSGIGLQGLFLAAAVLTLGTPAGFSIRGLSWKFPWLEESTTVPAAPSVFPALAADIKPATASPSLSLQCIAASQASAIFCVVVRNPSVRSLLLQSGQLNLSELGLADAPWPVPTTAPYLPERCPVAKVQIAADRDLPGTAHAFPLALSIPPGHERRFLLHVDLVNLPVAQRNRFFAVGSLVLSGGMEEVASADFNLFGARMEQKAAQPAGRDASPAYAAATVPTAALKHVESSPGEPINRQPLILPPPPVPQSPDLMERVSSRLGKMADSVSDLRHKVPLPFASSPTAQPVGRPTER